MVKDLKLICHFRKSDYITFDARVGLIGISAQEPKSSNIARAIITKHQTDILINWLIKARKEMS